MKQAKNPPKCGSCLTILYIEYLEDGTADKIYCPKCNKVYYNWADWKKTKGDKDDV